MIRFTVLFSLLFSVKLSAQDILHKIYLNAMLRETVVSLSVYSLELSDAGEGLFNGIITEKSGVIKAKGGYIKAQKEFQEHGHFTFYYADGKVESEGEYDHGIKVGNWQRFAADGTKKPDRYYNPASTTIIHDAMTGNLSK